MNLGRILVGLLLLVSVVCALFVVNGALCGRMSSDQSRGTCGAVLVLFALCASCVYLGVEYSLASEAGGGYSLTERRQQEAAADNEARDVLDRQTAPGAMAGSAVDPDDYSR